MIKTGDLIIIDDPIWLYDSKGVDGPLNPAYLIPRNELILIIDKLFDKHFIKIMWKNKQYWVEKDRLPSEILYSVEK